MYPITVKLISKNRTFIAATGSLNTFPMKFAIIAKPFCIGTIVLFITNAPKTENAPAIIPVAEIEVPANLFTAATTT